MNKLLITLFIKIYIIIFFILHGEFMKDSTEGGQTHFFRFTWKYKPILIYTNGNTNPFFQISINPQKLITFSDFILTFSDFRFQSTHKKWRFNRRRTFNILTFSDFILTFNITTRSNPFVHNHQKQSIHLRI